MTAGLRSNVFNRRPPDLRTEASGKSTVRLDHDVDLRRGVAGWQRQTEEGFTGESTYGLEAKLEEGRPQP